MAKKKNSQQMIKQVCVVRLQQADMDEWINELKIAAGQLKRPSAKTAVLPSRPATVISGYEDLPEGWEAKVDPKTQRYVEFSF